MRPVNDLIIQGRIGKEPEFGQTNSGNDVVNFSIAVNRGRDNPPDWYNVVSYDSKVCNDIRNYFHKGYGIIVHGSIKGNNWTDKNNVQHESVQIVADGVSFCGDGAKREKESQSEGNVTPFQPLDTNDGDLPF